MRGMEKLTDTEKGKLKAWYQEATGGKEGVMHLFRYLWLYKYLLKQCSRRRECDPQLFDFKAHISPMDTENVGREAIDKWLSQFGPAPDTRSSRAAYVDETEERLKLCESELDAAADAINVCEGALADCRKRGPGEVRHVPHAEEVEPPPKEKVPLPVHTVTVEQLCAWLPAEFHIESKETTEGISAEMEMVKFHTGGRTADILKAFHEFIERGLIHRVGEDADGPLYACVTTHAVEVPGEEVTPSDCPEPFYHEVRAPTKKCLIEWARQHGVGFYPGFNLDKWVAGWKGHCPCYPWRKSCPCWESTDELERLGRCGCCIFVKEGVRCVPPVGSGL